MKDSSIYDLFISYAHLDNQPISKGRKGWRSNFHYSLEFTFILAILVFGLVFLIPQNLYSQNNGFKYLKNYSYEEYDHTPQNWGIVQAPNGIIYVANQGGVLEFDGVSWRIIGIPEYAPVRSIAIDETGTVYIGGTNKIGYLAPDGNGTLQYQSLVDRLENNEKNFSHVWSTHATKDGVYFRTLKFLFHWDTKKIKKWSTPHYFWSSFICNGDLFVHEKNRGLLKMVDGSLQLLPGTEPFAGDRIYLLAPYHKDNARELIMGIRSKGFYLYDGKAVKPFPTKVDDYLRENKLSHGIRISSSDFALATINGGLVIMDSNGGLKDIFDKSSGLQDNTIYHIFEDTQGNLWLCLENGISKIEYASSISIYDERSNLKGIPLSVVKQQGDLYVGTTNGLFQLESSSKFRRIPAVSSPCWSLYSTADSLLAATTEGVFQVAKNFKKKVIGTPSYILFPSPHHPGLTWCGTSEGLAVLSSKDGNWKGEGRLSTINQEVRSIAENKSGNLWLGTVSGGVFNVDFPGDIREPLITHYYTTHGLPEGEINVAMAAGHIVFATTKGLFRFDEKTGNFIPDLTLGDEFADGSRQVFRVAEDKKKHIWFHSASRNYQAIPQSGGYFKIDDQPFRRIPTSAQVNSIYPDPDGKIIWFTSHKGLIRYDTTVKKNYRQTFHTLIRRVLINEKQKNEKQILGGCVSKSKSGKAGKDIFPVIEYRERNLHFEFAAPFFEAETETKYQYLLDGYDSDWSVWSKYPRKNYTNLDPGLYSFRVRARNIYNHLGEEDVFKFKILPPWYMTWWAYLLYLGFFLLLMFLVVKWRSHKLARDKKKLEHTIKERTQEIQEKNKQLKDQSEKLQEMDKVKSRFFANISHEFRTPLTLIMSPAEQMQSEVKNKHHKEKLKTMLRGSQRLLTLINQLLDLARIDSGKLKLQVTDQNIVSFLKGILASFYILTQQNQLALEFQSEEEEIPLYFDPPKMEEVIHNLLINAVKFTPPDGKITVSVFRDQQESTAEGVKLKRYVKISVRDTGIGISQEQITHIFDRFFQAENLKVKSHKGTGIGLALAKEIIQLHHGTIDAHSQEGEGTEFVIRLHMGSEHLKPNEIADPSAAPYKPQKDKEIETLYMKMETEKQTEQKNDIDKMEEGEEDIDDEKPVILVVEDDADVRKYIRDPLVESHYTVVEAGDGKEGIEKALKIIPDLIVSDIMMPEPDGYELCKTLKADIRTSHVPIVLLTAKASEESIIQGLKTGADDYVTKPFNSKILLNRIKNLIDLRKQLQLKLQRESLKMPSEIKVSSLDAQFLNKFKGIIEENLSDEDFRIDDLCEKLGLKRANLFKKIKALTGGTPNQFIVSYRLDRGAQLLRENFGNVTDVAMAVGFNTAAYFTKCFNDKFHMSPSTYQASESKSESAPEVNPESL